MAANIADFKEWLSGRIFYIDPPAWNYIVTPARIAIVPVWKPTVFVSVFFFVICGFALPLCWANYHLRNLDEVIGVIFGIFVGGFGGVAFGILLVIFLRNQLRGPYFVLSVADKSVSLPRDHLTISRVDVLGWRLVSGNWIGPEGDQKLIDYALAELQLIVKTVNGAMAYGIVAGKPQSITVPSTEIAKLTQLPIETVVQHQGVCDRPVSKLRLFWRSGGM